MSYSPKATRLYLHPLHIGTLTQSDAGAGENAVQAESGNLLRGDALRLSLKLRASDETILDAKFQNLGSGMPLASASQFCSMAIGKTLAAALKISAADLDRELDGLPELKHRQPVLVLEAFAEAAKNFHGQPARRVPLKNERMTCYCFQVPEAMIETSIRLRRLTTLEDVMDATNAGCGCHTCHPDIEDILDRCARGEFHVHIPPEEYAAAQRLYGAPPPSAKELALNPPAPPPATRGGPARGARMAEDGFVYPLNSPVAALTAMPRPRARKNPRPWPEMPHAERVARIQEVLEYDLRPAIRTDGGDIQFLGLEGEKVKVMLHGHCRNCHSATHTLKNGVEKRLQDAVWPALEVEEVFEKSGE